MKIELKKITYAAKLSEETSAYTAQLWVDGEHIANISNAGHGGCDNQYPAKGKTYADIQRVEDHIRTTYPKREVEVVGGQSFTMEQNLDLVCARLLMDWLLAKDLRRLLGRTTAFIKTNGKLYTLRNSKKVPAAALIATCDKIKAEGGKVLNNLPFEEALRLYQKVAD